MGDKSQFDGYLKYAGRFIWYYSYTVEDKKNREHKQKVTVFLDEELRNREESDYLDRIENKVKNYSVETFHRKRHVFGTIAIIDNTEKSAHDVYHCYKTRAQVETMIDALKNIVDADKTYMQNPKGGCL